MNPFRDGANEQPPLPDAKPVQIQSLESDVDFWSAVVVALCGVEDCKKTDTCIEWADKLVAARNIRFGHLKRT
jgi:hypothetical protein